MSSAVILISEPLNYSQYEQIILQTIDLLLEGVSIQTEYEERITQQCTKELQLAEYQLVKKTLMKKLFFYIVPRVESVNMLNNYLLGLYNLSRKVILEKERLAGFAIKPPFHTQVLFNVEDVNIKNDDGSYVYSWDYVVSDTAAQLNYEKDHVYIDRFRLDNKQMPKIKLFYEGNEKLESYEIGCVGGTFDHLHDGHKILLSTGAFLSTKSLIVGISKDNLLVNKKYKDFLQSYEERYKVVQSFVHYLKPRRFATEIYELNDIYGPTAFVPKMDLLLVTEETAKGGVAVNDKRRENNLSQLQVFTVKLVADDCQEDKISSTYIRQLQCEEFEKLTKQNSK